MGKLKITQVRSLIRQSKKQRATMEALGIHKMHQSVVHNDTPQIRGMVDVVRHLIEVADEDSASADN